MSPRCSKAGLLTIISLYLGFYQKTLLVVEGFGVIRSPTRSAIAPRSSIVKVLPSQRDHPLSISFPSASSVCSSSSSSNDSESESTVSTREFDSDALLKYVIAAMAQMACFTTLFQFLDRVLAQLQLTNSIPGILIGLLFYSFSLRSRIFNPLNNDRPTKAKVPTDRIMPSWTPPGIFFPIMWVLIIGPLRAYSSTLIVQANSGLFCTPQTLAFVLHLSMGDVWNTMNNSEQRYGAAVVGVMLVVSTILFAAWMYLNLMPLAGKLLGATALWIVTAAALITQTWRLNPDKEGKLDKLYPTKEEGKESITQFSWFQKPSEE